MSSQLRNVRKPPQLLTKFNSALDWCLHIINEPTPTSRWFDTRARYVQKTLHSIIWYAHQYQTAMVVTRLLHATRLTDPLAGSVRALAYECCQYVPAWVAMRRLAPDAAKMEKEGPWSTQRLLGTILLVLQEVRALLTGPDSVTYSRSKTVGHRCKQRRPGR